jgi:hypothetical protein
MGHAGSGQSRVSGEDREMVTGCLGSGE